MLIPTRLDVGVGTPTYKGITAIKKSMKKLLFFTLFLSTFATADDIYKCIDDNGKTRFSQRPCSDTAEKVELKDSSAGVKFGGDDSWDNVKFSNKEREVNRKIEKHQQALDQLRAEKNKKIADLKYQKQFAAKNIAGKKYAKNLDKEIRRTTNEYNRRIGAEENAIKSLKIELETDWK